MDFFGAQDLARRRTWILAGLFAAAVTSLVVLTNLLVAVVYAWTMGFGQADPLDPTGTLARLPARYWFWITFLVVGTVGLACLYKYLWLRGGGRTIAEALGGRLVPTDTADPLERRLLNVVEEMAIASGLPVPPVYIVPEPGINAFAAGLGFADAVIGVNQGTLELLDRDELQGVIGHEFSHLLNGDSRLNLRLLALLHGILFIGLVGHGLLRGTASAAGRSRRTGGAGRAGSAGLPLLVLGLGLLVIGYAGTLFGKLIKAAVSRQREYLADAAAVQFTRNPGGIAGALKKIGGHSVGSYMRGAAAAEASHIFFGPVARAWLGGLTATHPPLERRIRALDPRWDGRYPAPDPVAIRRAAAAESAGAAAGAAGMAAAGLASAVAGAAVAGPVDAAGSIRTDGIVAAVGRLDDAALGAAVRLIDGLPAPLYDAAHDAWSSRALLFAMVMQPDRAAEQVRHLETQGEPGLALAAGRLLPFVAPLDEAQRLVLVELAMPALKSLSPAQYRRFAACLVELIRADRRIDLFEWVLHRLLVRDLGSHFEPKSERPAVSAAQGDPARATAELLAALAREQDPAGAAAAFGTGATQAGIGIAYDPRPDPDFRRLNAALAVLRALPALQKPRIIKACATTVLADGQVGARQGALLQGIAAALDCPLPPSIYPVPAGA
ncbi:MAG: M48 family metallopeptidase [Pseudomonadales bacterium]|nr:M48 family metallopeptidase [Pseudomonadales bacterium]